VSVADNSELKMKNNNKNKLPLYKKMIKTLPVVVGVVVLAYLALMIKNIEVSTVLPIAGVEVKGELAFMNKDEIRSIVEDNISGGFFTVDLNRVRNRVREIVSQQPWIENVSLRRRWPDILEVFVEERKPIAFWNDDGYISENGYVFKPKSIDKKLNLPDLDGPDGQHNNVWKFMNVLYKEMSLLNYTVTSLELDERRAWQLKIEKNVGLGDEETRSGISVRLGRFDTEKRLRRFVRVLPELAAEKEFADNNINVIDMRYPNGFAVQMATNEVVSSTKPVVDKMAIMKKIQQQNIAHDFASMQKSEV
jgi:cell division protein FtsQ